MTGGSRLLVQVKEGFLIVRVLHNGGSKEEYLVCEDILRTNNINCQP